MSHDKSLFIRDLPYLEIKDISLIIDENDQWLELATHMGYGNTDIQVNSFLIGIHL